MIKRIISAAIAIPIILWIIGTHNPIILPLFLGIISILLAYEFISFNREDIDKWHLFIIAILLLALYGTKCLFLLDRITELACHRFTYFLILLSVVLPGGLEVFKHSFKPSIKRMGLSTLAFIYLGVVFSHTIELRFFHRYVDGQLPNTIGIMYLIYVFVIAWMYDAGGYFIGIFFGKKKIGLSVSPNKSWAGFFGGLFFATVGYATYYYVLKSFYPETFAITVFYANPLGWVVFSIFLAIFSQMGDFIESVFKRSAGVKNSSQLIAGHGGLFDTIDSVIPTVCLFFYLLLLI